MLKIDRSIFALIILTCFMAKAAFCGCPEEFKQKMLELKWVAYAPTHFDPERGIFPSRESIEEDLLTLYGYGFRGVVTYGSDRTLGDIPRIAKEIGFNGVIMGIWDIESQEEKKNAVSAAKFVDGYCIGNEGLGLRYELDALNKAILEIKDLTNKPTTTTEQIGDYSNDKVFSMGDWIFPNIHPFLCEVKDPKKAATWIEKHYGILKKHCANGRVVLFKEVGYPTKGAPEATQLNQMIFFISMESKLIPFVYFEAFDQSWKNNLPCEPYWGIFGQNRKPKRYIAWSLKKEGR